MQNMFVCGQRTPNTLHTLDPFSHNDVDLLIVYLSPVCRWRSHVCVPGLYSVSPFVCVPSLLVKIPRVCPRFVCDPILCVSPVCMCPRFVCVSGYQSQKSICSLSLAYDAENWKWISNLNESRFFFIIYTPFCITLQWEFPPTNWGPVCITGWLFPRMSRVLHTHTRDKYQQTGDLARLASDFVRKHVFI